MTIAEFWKERYDVAVAEKKALGDKLRETLDENKKLQLQLEAEKEENESLHNVIDSFVDKCKELEDRVECYKKKLELLNTVVTPDLDAQLKSMTERLDKANADRKELQADRDFWVHDSAEKTVEIQSLKNDLEKSNSDRDAYHGLYTELRKDYDRLFEEVRALKVPGCPSLEELKKKIQSLEDDIEFKTLCRDGWRDRAEQAERQLEEKKQQSYSNGYSDGNEEGQNELWEMLQMVKDMQPNEFDTECECFGDVIDMDLEDFKEAYGKWEAEQKKAAEEAKKQHVEFMRGYLKKYCIGRLCINCPLYDTSKPVSSCLFSKLTDEEIEERYRKAVDSECKKRLDQLWECTINKDLLKEVCGVTPEEEAHKLEYGDAVRVPWRDYDYMYIGPDEKEETLVHLFDAENHAIVTTHISNVRYNGGRILVSEEDDIRKIWKYMK